MKKIIFLVLILCLPIAMGFEYQIQELKNCVGAVTVSDRTEHRGNYSIKNCDKNGKDWSCPCNPLPKKIILEYKHKEVGEYDFVMEYYVGNNNDQNNKRTVSFEGLKISAPKEKRTFAFPKLEGNLSMIIMIVILVLVGLGILIAGGLFIKNMMDKQDIEYSDTTQTESIDTIEIDDDDVSDILDKYG